MIKTAVALVVLLLSQLVHPLAAFADVTMPDVVGKDPSVAEALITAAGFTGTNAQVVLTTDSTAAVGKVADQVPAAGATFTDSNTNTTIYISQGIITMPDVVGQSQDAAKAILQSKGFTSITVVQQASDTVATGDVISQSPAAGTNNVDASTAVIITVSTGPTTVAVPDVSGKPQAVAQSTIEAAGLVADIQSVASTTVAPGSVAQQIPAAGATVAVGSTVTLYISTGVTVPNVVGMTQDAAKATLTAAGLSGTVTIVQQNSTADSGTVLAQDPAAGSQAAATAAITLTVSNGKTSVPDVVGLSQANAIAALQSAGFSVAVTFSSSSGVTKGNVISQTPTGGTAATPTTVTVIITVSSGPAVGDNSANQATVPDVTGQLLSDARTALTAAGFNVSVRYQISTTDPDGTVLSQSPLGTTVTTKGITVTLLVAQVPPQLAMVQVPDVTGMSFADASDALLAAGLDLQVLVQYRDDLPTAQVLAQDPAAGTQVVNGSTVTLTIVGHQQAGAPLPWSVPLLLER